MPHMELFEGERVDDLQYKGLKIIQHESLFRFGTDSVLLAGFSSLNKNERAVDLGSGSGILSILINARFGCPVIGIEIQDAFVSMANRSAVMNGQENVRFLNLDVRDAPAQLGDGAFDVGICNPPYFDVTTTNSSQNMAISRHTTACSLEDIIKSAKRLIRHGGRLYIVYPATRLFILSNVLSSQRLEIKRYRLVMTSANADPYLVLIEARRGGKPGAIAMPPLILHQENGAYTPEAREIYHIAGNTF